mgnify:CR=1 FL=1
MNQTAKQFGWSTAISRTKPSAPMQKVIEQLGDISTKRILDYGCGRGFDADHYNFLKYDPNPRWGCTEMPEGKFDVIVCNYVLNVVPQKHHEEILQDIKSRLNENGVAYISVRADLARDTPTQWDVELDLPLVVKVSGRYRIYKMEA